MKAQISEIFMCACHGEGVILRRDDDQAYLSIWGFMNNIGLRWRVKQAWHALRGSSSTEVVLTFATAKDLGAKLTAIEQQPHMFGDDS
jgi:hypothetical protein